MSQFRFVGVAPNGRTLQAEFEALSKKDAKKKAERLSQKRALKLKALDEKVVWLYKARKKAVGGWVEGEQEAYTKEDVQKALEKLGFSEIKVNKKLELFKGGVPMNDVVTFIRLSADLLKQKLPYDEILGLLLEDTQNKRMREVIKQIQKDLRDGKEGSEVYGKHEDIFGKFAAFMLGVATTSGNIAQIFESTAKFLERDAEFKKNLRRSLMMPAITILAIIGVILFYVGYIFPATAEMFLRFDIELPPMTAATLELSYWLTDHWIALNLAFILPIIGFVAFIKTPKGKVLFDQYLIKIPLVGDLLHKTSIEIFSRVFYTLYSGSGQNIEVIRIGAEACRNSYMEKQIKEVAIPMMLDDGRGLVEAFEATGVFTHTALSRFKLGVESGALKDNAYQLANYYETQTTYKMASLIDTINLFINLFIMVALIIITVVSSEAAIIKPSSQF
ncbi:MAG: type II secretion system F family protein [Balneolia bacterium]|nr:type II secretion system F family protein [Balneolia bacterium]